MKQVLLFFCIFTIATLISATSHSNEVEPVNPNTNEITRKVFNYLNSIQGKQMLAGHHGMYGDMLTRDINHIVESTGKYPALLELEGGIFARKYHDDYANIQSELLQSAIDHWNKGGIVAICWHWGNPLEPVNTYPNTKIKFDIEAAFEDGTPEHKAMMKDLDVMAGLLNELQDANVPVLFRPLHEICGGWFWWSMQGEENAEKLWQYIYDYYTDHHQLNNLLWVYSYSHETKPEWFAGLDYVDIVGIDIYKRGQTASKDYFDMMASVAGNKAIALSECEEIPDPDTLQERGIMWNWFTTWHSQYLRKNEPEFLKRVYNHELVITRDELPKFE